MGDVGASDDPSPSGSSSSVTRLIQHAILQLCNEHVGYDHTLQVLGVLCVTVDDRSEEIVVKINNTLKRVDAVSAASEHSGIRVSTTSLVVRGAGKATTSGVEPVSCSSTGTGSSTAAGSSTSPDPPPTDGSNIVVGSSLLDVEGDGNSSACPLIEIRPYARDNPILMAVGSPSVVVSGSIVASGRKIHGRKQSNPVKVKSLTPDDDGEEKEASNDVGSVSPVIDAEPYPVANSLEGCSSPSVTPSKRSSGDHEQIAISPSGLRLLGNKRVCSSEVSAADRQRANRQEFGSGSLTVRALLANLSSRNVPDIRRTDARSSPMSGLDRGMSPEDNVRRTPIVVAPIEIRDEQHRDARPGTGQQQQQQQDAALNFSRNALDCPGAKLGRSSDHEEHGKGIGLNGVKVKEEFHSAFPSAYNLDYLLGAAAASGNAFDLTQMVANYGSFLGDNQFLSMPGFDPHHLALMYGSLAAAGNCSQMPNLASSSPISGITPRPCAGTTMGATESEASQEAADGESMRRYSVTNRLNNGLTMHFSRTNPAIRRRNRFGSRHLGASGPGKVKDIIMYDESAPLHAQRGSRIEGDFMLDSLRVDGKRRRRRTAEDTLTAEEIAEYMGCDTRSPTENGTPSSSCQLACRYCGEVTTDLSRYFSHTLSSHGAYICHQCGKSFTTKSSLLRHRPIHTGMRRFACSICHKAFYRKDKCKAHIKRHLGIGEGTMIGNVNGRASQLPTPTSDQSPYTGGGPIDIAV